MSTERSETTLASAARAWVNFWFSPADPTPLCLMRIAAGLLTLYVHIAYTFDLVAFFGPDAWCDQTLCNSIRREYPHIQPRNDWKPMQYEFRMPSSPIQRVVLHDFINRVIECPYPDRALDFMKSVGLAGEE